MARQRMNEADISHQIDLRMLRDIIKIVRQLNTSGDSGGEEGEFNMADVDRKIKLIGKMAALAAVGAISDPNIRLRAMPLIRGM
jgi:hypothetical protein